MTTATAQKLEVHYVNIKDIILAAPASKKTPHICKNCNKIFIEYASNNRDFCSKPCYSEYQKNHSEFTGNLGTIDLSCHNCKKWFKVRLTSHNRRVSVSPKGSHKLNFCSKQCSCDYFSKTIYGWRNDSKGESNPAWRGGNSRIRARIESTRKYQDFRKFVFNRDGHKCKVCKSTKSLELHHIIAYHKDPSLFLETSNAITLCKKHHDLTKHKEHLFVNIFQSALKENTDFCTKNGREWSVLRNNEDISSDYGVKDAGKVQA